MIKRHKTVNKQKKLLKMVYFTSFKAKTQDATGWYS